VNWVSGSGISKPFEAKIKIRYTARFEPGTITPRQDGTIEVKFYRLLPDITPGQAAVGYIKDQAVVSGIIQGYMTSVKKFKPIRIIS
jgi:tRNA-specific 2-thiouridylase